MSIFKKKRLPTVRVVIYIGEGEWVAHCLDMDIIATGATTEAVEKDIVDLILAQITFAIENNNLENIYHPAPPESWARLTRVKSCNVRKIKERDHIPIGGVEFCIA